jgi:GNAT superfamily N-acetyltransferase
MTIRVAETDTEIAACFPVMHELRPHLSESEFVPRIRAQQKAGYRLLYLVGEAGVVAVAGIRLGENLAWGRFLYIDDLVVSAAHRSSGHGARLLYWLKDYALKEACGQIHLDSGMQRQEAHRFYERLGMRKTGFHFAEPLS